MVQASDLRHLSLIGRYAFALACVEAVCAAWAVDDPFVLGEIDAHWEAAEMRFACHWFDTHDFPLDTEEFATRLRPGQLSADQAESLFEAFHETQMVICGSCYSAMKDDGSISSVLRVAGVLTRSGVELPALSRFAHATWSGEFWRHGCGERFPRKSYRAGGQCQDAEPGAAADGGAR